MKKYIFLYAFFFISMQITTAQVGVNTEEPTETLDINGTLRIRGGTELTTNSEPWLLSTSSEGVVKKIPANTFSPVISNMTVNTPFNDTIRVTVPDGYTNFQLDITSENACNRWVYASFRYAGKETILLGGAARGMNIGTDATVTTVGIPPDGISWGSSFHAYWDRNKVVGCNTYGNASKTTNTTANYLYDFWIRRTDSDIVSFVWGAIEDPSAIQEHTVIETKSLNWNFIFTKL